MSNLYYVYRNSVGDLQTFTTQKDCFEFLKFSHPERSFRIDYKTSRVYEIINDDEAKFFITLSVLKVIDRDESFINEVTSMIGSIYDWVSTGQDFKEIEPVMSKLEKLMRKDNDL